MQKVILLLVQLCFSIITVAQNDSMYKTHIQKARQLYKSGSYQASAQEYSNAFTVSNSNEPASDRYDAACSWSLYGDLDSAYHHLTIAAQKKWSNYKHTSIDTDLEAIRNDKRWVTVIEKIRSNKRELQKGMSLKMIETLDSIYITDQKYRHQLSIVEKEFGRKSEEVQALWKTIVHYDSINTEKVVTILDKYGWLDPKDVGKSGSQTLFLVIQHTNISIQQRYLPMMRQAVKDKKASPSGLALLEDRVALRTGGKQVYGSQIGRDKDGKYYVSPLIDPENVDKRRTEVGLGTISNYVKRWGIIWDIEAHKKRCEKLENNSETNKTR